MSVQRPRMIVRLVVPNVGTPQERVAQEQTDDVTILDVKCHRLRLESNSHNEADEVDLEIAMDDAGIDPRFLKSAEVYVYVGNADEHGNFAATTATLRFIGIATNVTRTMTEGRKGVRVRALDYTTLFISAKQFPPEGIPDFSQNLTEAWARICDHTGIYDWSTRTVSSTVSRLRDRIEFRGLSAPGPVIGKAVAPRLAKLGKVHNKSDHADAWAIWQTCCGSLGLITFIRNDRVIVTTATDYYTREDPPVLIYGQNIKTLEEDRDTLAMSGKNVGLFSFDPLSGHTVEAFWPPLSAARKQKKTAAGALGPGVVARAQDYEVFDYDGGPTMTADQLQEIAHRVWEERSRQELRGKLTTGEMFVSRLSDVNTLSDTSFDLLALQAGDRIRVEIDRTALTLIQRLPSIGERRAALLARGYSSDMANFITRNLDAIVRVTPEFQVHKAIIELDTTNEDGHFGIEVEFLNRIEVSGAAQPNTQGATKNAPATTGQSDTDSVQKRISTASNKRGQ